jgi:hypothetical protein
MGIGQDVSIDLKVGDRIYFHPSCLTMIPDETWDVINESGVICKTGEV